MRDLSEFVFILSEIMLIGIFFASLDFAYGESDLTLEARSINNSLDLSIVKFGIQGESYKEICPSGQCKIDYIDKYTYFHGPSLEFMAMSVTIDFRLQDDITNADVGPKKKDFIEQFTASTFCDVNDIIEENGQEVYTCHDGSSSITRKFDQKSWDYDTIAIFDAKNNTLKVFGNTTGGIPDYNTNTTEYKTPFLNATSNAESGTDAKPRTFEDCFSEGMGIMTLGLIFAPTEKLGVTDLLDPTFKKMIINMCNFYHEKTGIWINMMSDGDIIQQYNSEFYQKYGDTFPEKLKEMARNQSR